MIKNFKDLEKIKETPRMNFRPLNFAKDLPQVIRLINKNLDPEMTEEFFRWKHYENPFGSSFGLVALDNEKIIGLRMFMIWEFFNHLKGDKALAIRPVDTVTDLNYRGKGLFKKLTLQGIEECSGKYDFIFNTPNENSRPGYLKMGWSSLEQINYFRVGIINFFTKTVHYEEANSIFKTLSKPNTAYDIYSTNKSSDFLAWRYKSPEYLVANFEKEGCLIIYKKMSIKGLPFVMIYEILGDISYFTSMVRSVCKKNKTPFVYYYNSKEFESIDFIKTFRRVQPVVVLKEANRDVYKDFNFSLGDLEGKL